MRLQLITANLQLVTDRLIFTWKLLELKHQKKEGFTKNEEKKLDVPTEQQIHECDGSTGTHGDNHGNQPFLHVVFRTGQDAGRFQKTQKVLNHDEMDQPPYG